MRDILLTTHFFGLTISAGTGLYLAAMSRYAATHLPREQIKPLLLGPGGALSKVGNIGLAVMVVSGLAMALTSGGPAAFNHYFWIKMSLVTLVVIYVGLMNYLSHKARHEEGSETLLRMKKLGPVGLTLAVLTLAASVMSFH